MPGAGMSPYTGLDCHLDHTVIPNMPQKDSLGAFLDSFADS
jgi:hypothetical protein